MFVFKHNPPTNHIRQNNNDKGRRPQQNVRGKVFTKRTFKIPTNRVKRMIRKPGEAFVPRMNSASVVAPQRSIIQLQGRELRFDPYEIRMQTVGARSGDKLHEGGARAIDEHEAERALELNNLFVVLPALLQLRKQLKQGHLNMRTRPAKSGPYGSKNIDALDDEQIPTPLSSYDFQRGACARWSWRIHSAHLGKDSDRIQ